VQERTFRTQQEAADFIEVTTRTIRNWTYNRMKRAANGEYSENELRKFKARGEACIRHKTEVTKQTETIIFQVEVDWEARRIVSVEPLHLKGSESPK